MSRKPKERVLYNLETFLSYKTDLIINSSWALLRPARAAEAWWPSQPAFPTLLGP